MKAGLPLTELAQTLDPPLKYPSQLPNHLFRLVTLYPIEKLCASVYIYLLNLCVNFPMLCIIIFSESKFIFQRLI